MAQPLGSRRLPQVDVIGQLRGLVPCGRCCGSKPVKGTTDELLRPGQTDGDTRTPSNARNQRDAQACAICSRGTALPSARDAMIDARHVSLRATVWKTLENINVTNVIRATVQKRQSRTEVFVLHCPSLPAPWGGAPPPPTGIRRSVHNQSTKCGCEAHEAHDHLACRDTCGSSPHPHGCLASPPCAHGAPQMPPSSSPELQQLHGVCGCACAQVAMADRSRAARGDAEGGARLAAAHAGCTKCGEPPRSRLRLAV